MKTLQVYRVEFWRRTEEHRSIRLKENIAVGARSFNEAMAMVKNSDRFESFIAIKETDLFVRVEGEE